ncbi:hypothetical protein V5738_08880 [Salinisphaera sp. SPP-AMP-43]|uniref:hypothetical protein n=1 Tax=Salinisphaera sp. SPP-AMP-43 TaxID=3121288 RepID=UPI003C6E1529
MHESSSQKREKRGESGYWRDYRGARGNAGVCPKLVSLHTKTAGRIDIGEIGNQADVMQFTVATMIGCRLKAHVIDRAGVLNAIGCR